MKEFLVAFLGSTLQITPDAVAALFNADESLKEEALTTAKALHADHIRALREKDGKTFDNGYKKAQAEVATKREKSIAAAIGLETELTGDEFNAAIADFIAEKVVGTKTITDEVIKSHPVFKAREKELAKQLKDAQDKAAQDLEKVTKEVKQKEVLSKVHARAIALIKEKALLPEDEEKALKQLKRLVLDDLGNYEYDFNDANEIVAINKDSKRVEDAHGNALSFDELVNQISTGNGMEFKKVTPKETPNPKGNPGAPPAAKKPIVLPKTEQDYAKYITNQDIPLEDRSAMKEAWAASKTNG